MSDQNVKRLDQGAVANMEVEEAGNNVIAPPAQVAANEDNEHGHRKASKLAKATLTVGKVGNFEPAEPPRRNSPGGCCHFVASF